MTFADDLRAQAARHHAENVARLRAQASKRARDNGFDEVMAADAAEHAYGAGDESHELIVSMVAGPYRRSA